MAEDELAAKLWTTVSTDRLYGLGYDELAEENPTTFEEFDRMVRKTTSFWNDIGSRCDSDAVAGYRCRAKVTEMFEDARGSIDRWTVRGFWMGSFATSTIMNGDDESFSYDPNELLELRFRKMMGKSNVRVKRFADLVFMKHVVKKLRPD